MSEFGWRGKEVQNDDGRTGVIRSEYAGFLHIALTIEASDGSVDRVQLNTNGRDSGAKGWKWTHVDGRGVESLTYLGDHNI